MDVGTAELTATVVGVSGRARARHRGGQVLLDVAPEQRLPALAFRQRQTRPVGPDQQVFTRLPGGKPIGAVDLVLVVKIGQAFRQLLAAARIAVSRQEAAQRGKPGLLPRGGREGVQIAEQPVEAPTQGGLVIGGGIGEVAEQGAVGLPQKAPGQHQVHRRGDAAAATRRSGWRCPRQIVIRQRGQRELQPLTDAVALHQDDLVFQR